MVDLHLLYRLHHYLPIIFMPIGQSFSFRHLILLNLSLASDVVSWDHQFELLPPPGFFCFRYFTSPSLLSIGFHFCFDPKNRTNSQVASVSPRRFHSDFHLLLVFLDVSSYLLM